MVNQVRMRELPATDTTRTRRQIRGNVEEESGTETESNLSMFSILFKPLSVTLHLEDVRKERVTSYNYERRNLGSRDQEAQFLFQTKTKH